MMSTNCYHHHHQHNFNNHNAYSHSSASNCCWNSYSMDQDGRVHEDEEDFWTDYGSSSCSSSPITDSTIAALTVKRSLQCQAGDDGRKDDIVDVEDNKEKNNWRRSKGGGGSGGGYKHVPHKDKPPQVVAKRNARERRRVQAVNSAFLKLRRAVPMENTRGKRVSKVKTLQNAIDYINGLQKLLEEDDGHYHSVNIYSNYRYANSSYTFMEELPEFEDEI